MLLAVPDSFDLNATVLSSPIAALPPLRYDPKGRVLHLCLAAAGSGGRRTLPVAVTQAAPGQPLTLAVVEPRARGVDLEPFAATLRDMLRLEDDLSLFYALTDKDRELKFVRAAGAGRLLRSATVFEDLVKCLLVGRVAAPRARALCAALCERLDAPAFPDAAALAQQPQSFFDDLGARSLGKPLRALSERCVTGAFLPESLRRGPLAVQVPPFDDRDALAVLMEQELEWEDRVVNLLFGLPGFGARSVTLFLPLIGCYDALPMMDRVLNAFALRPRRGKGEGPLPRAAADRPVWRVRVGAQVERRVARFAHYRGLALHLLLSAPPG